MQEIGPIAGERELENVVVSATEEELEEAAGAGGCGWACSITDDCPNSVFVCC